MNRKYVLPSFAIVAVLCIASCNQQDSGQPNITSQDAVPTGPVGELLSSNESNRITARDEMMQARYDRIVKLVEIVERTHTDLGDTSSAVLAIQSLGFMRAGEAVTWLTSHINYRNGGQIITEISPSPAYPCVGALIAIGLPSVREMLRRPLHLVEYEHLELYAIVIRGVVGAETGKMMLKKAFDAKTGEAKAGLNRLMEIYDKQA